MVMRVCLCAFTSVLERVDELAVRGEYEPSFVTESQRGKFVKLLGRLRGLRMESDSQGKGEYRERS